MTLSSIHFDNTYCSLPSILYSRIQPRSFPHATIELLNKDVAKLLSLDPSELEMAEGIQLLSGGLSIDKAPFAQAYNGHQFGHYTTLGDGRAMMIGEQVVQDKRYDLHLKGSGPTPYSRRGDGNATLYSMLREYLISEAMHHLHVPTSRTLAVLNTHETVYREQDHQGAILCRVASSHIRVGTFEFARSSGSLDTLKQLADYTINRHFPYLKNDPDKYLNMFIEVVKNQAKLVAKWQSIGFVHGVLNTDNVLISGESIDFGPCAFLDQYRPDQTFSSIDQNGRYRYRQQPYITSWNLSKLAEALLPLIDSDAHEAVRKLNKGLRLFEAMFETEYYRLMGAKLGINNVHSNDHKLIDTWLSILETNDADFTNSFQTLTRKDVPSLTFNKDETFLQWYQDWQSRIEEGQSQEEAIDLMKQYNPVVIPRNQIVEQALRQYAFEGDTTLFYTLLSAYKDPFNYEKIMNLELLEPLHPNQSFTSYCGT